MSGPLESFIEPLNQLKAKEGVFYVTGNHEIYLGFDYPLEVFRKTNIRVLEDEVKDINGLQLVGISYPRFDLEDESGKDIRKILAQNPVFDPEKPNILLFHSPSVGQITGKDQGTDNGSRRLAMYFSPEIDFGPIEELGIDLQLSGHTHAGQIFPYNFFTRQVYVGYDYGLHQLGDFSINISSGTGVWGPTIRTWSRSEIVEIILEAK